MKSFLVKLNKHLPSEKKDKWIPDNYPVDVIPALPNQNPVDGYVIMTIDEISALNSKYWDEYHDLQIQKAVYYSSRKLRIIDLVADEFKNRSPNKIDFTMHLKHGIFLRKSNVTITPRGRPNTAIYYYNDIPYAKIHFTFEDDALGFMTRRTEVLSYYCIDGNIYDEYIIEDKHFDSSIQYDRQIQMNERIQGRSNVVASTQADVNRLLVNFQNANPEMSNQVGQMVTQFWVKFGPIISAWQNAGGTYLAYSLNTDTTFPFLDFPMNETQTVRQYIVSRISY